MNKFNPQALPCLPFSKVYENNIQCKIAEIDTFLKTTPPPYNTRSITDLLHITPSELCYIMEKQSISSFNILSFFTLVQHSSSYICKLIQRQWKYGNIEYYTPEIVAYIYELNLDKVRLAFKQSGLKQVESHNLKEIFSYIYVPIMNFQNPPTNPDK